jgi:hypothetical protein
LEHGEQVVYRRFLPQLNLSIERNTDKVPCDGKYYLLKDGEIVKIFRSQVKADQEFQKMVEESGFKPKTPENIPLDQSNEALDRFFRDRIIFHAEGAKYRGRGGRSR